MQINPEQVKRAADRAEARAKGIPPDEPARNEAEFETSPTNIVWPEADRHNTPNKHSMVNVRKAISELKLTTRHDIFTGDYLVSGGDLGTFVGALDDKIARKFREVCFERFAYEPGKDATFEGLQRACEEYQFHPIKDYLDALKWDRVPRLSTWLSTYIGVEDTPLHRKWGELVLMAAVRRIYDPGCSFQHVLVLEGGEGVDKSSSVKVLASGQADLRPQYFSDSPILHVEERKQQELTRGVWFYEIAELAGMKKADQHSVKRFITAEEERARAAYAHFLQKQARVCVFIGTFNTDADSGELVEYLNPGDRRRWWPVRVGVLHPIRINELIRDRAQLFAEAKERVSPVEGITDEWASLRLPAKLWNDAAEVQKDREIENPLADTLSTLFSELIEQPHCLSTGTLVAKGRDYIVTGREVWVSSKLVVEITGKADRTGRVAAAAMRSLGWRKVRDNRDGRLPDEVRGWVHSRKR